MYRGTRPASDPLPVGVRKDTRKHTKHPLRPTKKMVKEYLARPSDEAWRNFRTQYLTLLENEFKRDRKPFDKLAALATTKDVHIGCSCPTTTNPRIDRCHTFLALRFMKKKYPSLTVKFPK